MSDRTYSIEEFQREQRKSREEELLAGQLHQAGIEDWEREYRFSPPRRWRFDFAWPDLKFAVEVEGLTGNPAKGGHQTPKGYRANLEKYNQATVQGWKVLRFEQAAVRSGEALRLIEQALKGTVS